MSVQLDTIEPFEICAIRPPTENVSLTFRLTRNCYWNRCKFCPVYKLGARFSRRDPADIFQDILRAKQIDELLFEKGFGSFGTMGNTDPRILLQDIYDARGIFEENDISDDASEGVEELDERLSWFMQWFKETPTLADSLNHVLSWRQAGGRTCFLGDADGLILKPDVLCGVLDRIQEVFPSIQRFTIYGRTKTAADRCSIDDLKALRRAGLDRIHYGLESGSEAVLTLMDKGVRPEEHVEAGLKTKAAGLACSVYVMPGLGGQKWSRRHATETAAVLTRMEPDYIRLRSLEVFPRTPLAQAVDSGAFVEATEEEVVQEIRILVEETRCATELLSDSASNLLPVNGRLPQDRPAMLETIDSYLSLNAREKKIFSVESRLQSFMGQYGGLSADIAGAVRPYIKENRLDFQDAADEDLDRISKLIRSKLMP